MYLTVQLMKIVESFPNDVDVQRAGLALVVDVAEYGGKPDQDEAEDTDDQMSSASVGSEIDQSSVADTAAVVNRLGIVGAVTFVAAWLREVTAPKWAWGSVECPPNDSEERASDLFMSCKAVFLLSQHSSTNRDRFASIGAAETLTKAVALSGRNSDLEDAADNVANECSPSEQDATVSIRAETQVWAAQAVAELAGGNANENRCTTLVRVGALRALFAAMTKRPSAKQLQRAGCMTLGSVAACLKPKDLQMLGRNGGAQAVIFALDACPGDENVAWAGLLAVAKLSVSANNRRLLGEAGGCPLITKVLQEFSKNIVIAEEGCRAVAKLATLSGFNRTALGCAGAAEAIAEALRSHPAQSTIQRWGLSAAAALVADTDPSDNTSRIINAGILNFTARALARFAHNPTVQAEGLRTLAKVATSGDEGTDATWAAGVVIPTARALGLYINDGDVQHWGMATIRALTGSEEKCEKWGGVGAPEAIIRNLRTFCQEGSGRRVHHDEMGEGRLSEARNCTIDELLCIQFQACATTIQLAISSPNARMRLVREGAGEALAVMMKTFPLDLAAQRAALTAIAALSASGAENRKRLHR